jgi:hypothetical protein
MDQELLDKRREQMAKARAARKVNLEQAAPDTAPPQQATPGQIIGRTASGRAVTMGRDGEELVRRRLSSSDPLHIEDSWIPEGWKWQWNVVTVTGQEQTDTQATMRLNGWRAVTADRLPGIFMHPGYKGEIVRDGLRLEERPKALHDEAMAEELAKARKQVQDQQEQLLLSKRGVLGDGYSDDPKYRGAGGMARQQYAPAHDIPRPRLEVDPSV